ncbi:CD209 antigen-like protein A [Oryzias melastigma]|uniref:CD209 antigen-like protein A n=1 Tax=Oryzias melastigma TaxID=30732 RepID=A0A834F8W8_ORYME|nr:CD209 antigen-like protein A [Oryzias melastigma]
METYKENKYFRDLEAKNEQLTLEKRDLQTQNEDLRMNMTKLENLTEHLTAEKTFFENQTKEMTVNMTILQMQTEQLRINRDELNRMKAAIFKYSTFPVDLFCPDGVGVAMYVQDTNLSELKLKVNTLEIQTEELSRERDDLSWMLEVILSFDNFPVKEICPDKKCPPCWKNWVQFQRKCYFFSSAEVLWKTWQESRQFCQNVSADLVVIDNPQEQEFISDHVQPYYDKYHGYWTGLEKKGNEWVWIDGQMNTLELQAGEQFPFGGRRGLLVPGKNVQQNLIKADALFKNKFICETGALMMTRSF